MNIEKFVNIVRLLMSNNFEIEALPDNLKCAKCKAVLKDACQIPCGCRFCRICIDNMMASGTELCPRTSEMCRESSLSLFTTDYEANNSVSRLTVRCVNIGCVHKCPLVNMEEHMRVCQKRFVKCPFRELGCNQANLAAEEMDVHLYQENRGHSEILLGMIAVMKREIEDHRTEIDVLKEREMANRREIEDNRTEIDVLKEREMANRREIDMLKQRGDNSKRKVENLKWELTLKDEETKSIIDQMTHVENENKLMKNEVEWIKNEKENLANRMKCFSEKVDREIEKIQSINERKPDNVTEQDFGCKLSPVIELIGSNKREITSDIKTVWDDIHSINTVVKSLADDVSCMKSQVKSLQAIVGLDDASFEWVIEDDLVTNRWSGRDKMSAYFVGAAYPYRYQLRSFNGGTVFGDSLNVWLHIYPCEKVAWPFEGRVVITVSDRNKRTVSRTVSQHCRIEKPSDNSYKRSNDFRFRHSELVGTGVDLTGGVCVSCVIVPGVGR